MNLNLLSALDALLAEGSVSGAARRMHVSTPAMSHTLARIREATGDQILVRAGRRSVPTIRAQEMREAVRKLVEEATMLLAPGDSGLSHVNRTFVIRAPDGVSIVFSSVLAQAMHEVMPKAKLRFISDADGDLTDLREGLIDLDIGSIDERSAEIQTELLFEQQLIGAVRAGHPLMSAPMSLKRFLGELHVTVLQRGSSSSAIDAALRASGLSRPVLLTVPSPYAALMAAARSDLVATAPGRLTQSVQTALGLTTFKLPVQLAPERVVQAWHPRSSADPAQKWLRGRLKKMLSGRSWLPSQP